MTLDSDITSLPTTPIPNVTATHTTDSGAYKRIFQALRDRSNKARGIYNIEAYGGIGDNIADDSQALRDTCAAACEAVNTEAIRSARIVIPDGTWLFDEPESTTDGVDYIAVINASNITVDISDGAVIRSTIPNPGGLQIFLPYGGFKNVAPEDFSTSSWAAFSYTSQAVLPMSPANKYQREIELPGGTAGVSAGDWIVPRAGLVGTLGAEDLPDCELNQVTEITGDFLSLRWPLAKPYVAENETGGFPLSAPGAGGAACPLGISVVTDLTIENFKIRGGYWDTPNAVWWVLAMNIYGCDISDMRGNFGWSAVGMQATRRGSMKNIRGTKMDPQILGAMIVGTAFGATDIQIDDIQADGEHPCMLHIHEGSAQVTVGPNISLTGRPSTTGKAGVSIRGRNYDTKLLGGRIIGGSGDAHCISIDLTCTDGGELSGWTAGGNPDLAGGHSTIGCVGTGWNIHDCDTEQIPVIGEGNRVSNLGRIADTGIGNVPRLHNLGDRIQLNTGIQYLGNTDTAPGATPSLNAAGLSVGPLYFVASTGAVTITNILDAYDFEIIYLIINTANITFKDVSTGGAFFLPGGGDLTPPAGSTMMLMRFALTNQWYVFGYEPY